MAAVNFILSLARKILARESKGITTIPNQMAVESKAGEIAATLQNAGIPLNRADEFIKSEQDLTRILNMIESTPPVMKEVPSGIRSTKSAKVFDLEGKEIPKGARIMGGKEVKDSNVDAIIQDIKSMDPIDSMKEANSVIGRKGKYKNLTSEESKKILQDTEDHIFERDIPDPEDMATGGRAGFKGGSYDRNSFEHKINELKSAYKRYKKGIGGRKGGIMTFEQFAPMFAAENFATGGRAGFKIGSIDKARRAFLKTMGVAGAGITALKTGLLGLGKGATKQAAKEIITTPAAAGKPAWFDALVTRVVNEGEDVTKKFATKDREIVHATKVDDDAMVTVYRDLDDGTVRVDIDDATTNVMGEQGDSVVSLQVKGGQLEEGVKGKTPVEFEAVEADYRNYMDGPDDYTTETIDNVVGDTKDLTADLTKVKMYAKGQKKPTIKEMMIQRDRAIRLKQAEENPAEYAADRGPDIDTKDYDYASGGIARMLGE